MVIKPGSAPTRAFNSLQRAALRILRRFGTDAHVYTAGANGAMVNLLQTGNYILSDGSTGYSAVDGPVGLVLDGAGSVGSELVTNGDFSNGLTGWSNTSTGTGTATVSSGQLNLYRLNSSNAGKVLQTVGSSGNTYAVTFQIVSGTAFVSLAGAGGNYTTGTYSFLWVASGSTLYIESVTDASTCVVDNISVKQVTGIHATQATTANKPTVRRGLLNLLTYSNDLTNAAWLVNAGVTKTNATTAVVGSSVSDTLYRTPTVTANAPNTWAMLISGTVGAQIKIRIEDGGAPFAGTEQTITLSATPTLYAVAHASTLTTVVVMLRSVGQACTVVSGGGGFFTGTLTAAQILDSGGIPLTTSAAASNPNAGRYSWSFDGGDSLALGSVPFQQSDDHAVICSGSYYTTANTGTLFSNEGATSTPLAALVQLSTSTSQVSCFWRDDAGTLVQLNSSYTLGEVCVVSARKVGNQRQVRKNGVLGGTSTTVLGTTTLTASGIGAWRANNYLNGNASIVIAIKGTLSDAEMLTLERFAASTLPNSPSF